MSIKPKLRVIVNEQPRKREKWQGHDPVFLHKDQIKNGTELVCFGRLDHGSIWKVQEIYRLTATGRRYRIDGVERSDNKIVLVRVGSNESRTMTFINLSYSAIWRLRNG